MIEVVKAALEIQSFIERNAYRFCFIGGVAVIRWGQHRLTSDVDITVYTGFQDEEQIIDAFLDVFEGRLQNTREFALRRRVLLLKTPFGFPFDASLGGLPFEERMMERSSLFPFLPDASLRTCSAEDLIILKAFASRAIDWMDIEGVIIKQGKAIDWDIVTTELTPLADWKEDPSILPRLQQMRESLS